MGYGSDWQQDAEAAHDQLIAWLDSIGSANGWSDGAIQALEQQAALALEAAGWWFPSAEDYWAEVLAGVNSWPTNIGTTTAMLPGWDGFVATVESAAGATATAEWQEEAYDVGSILEGVGEGALEDVSDISETAQEAITDPGSSPLVWIGGGLLAVVGLTQLNRILGR